MSDPLHSPEDSISNGQYLNLTMLFQYLTLDGGVESVILSAGHLEREFLASLNPSEASTGVRKGFGITGIRANVFVTHYRTLVTLLAKAYGAGADARSKDFLNTWPKEGAGARLILDTYRKEAIRILGMGSEEGYRLLGYDPSQAHPAIGTEGYSLVSVLGQIHIGQIIGRLRDA